MRNRLECWFAAIEARVPDNFRLPNIPRIPTSKERVRSEYLGNDFAGDILKKIVQQIRLFESVLTDDEEVGLSLVTNNGFEQVVIEKLYVLPPETLVFRGFDSCGNRVALIQHATQTNVLLRAIRKQSDSARRIGFEISAASSGEGS